MIEQIEESDAEFEAFLDAIDRALTEIYGSHHQFVLGNAAKVTRSFEGWNDEPKSSC